jgi:hypothetical protein
MFGILAEILPLNGRQYRNIKLQYPVIYCFFRLILMQRYFGVRIAVNSQEFEQGGREGRHLYTVTLKSRSQRWPFYSPLSSFNMTTVMSRQHQSVFSLHFNLPHPNHKQLLVHEYFWGRQRGREMSSRCSVACRDMVLYFTVFGCVPEKWKASFWVWKLQRQLLAYARRTS